MTDMPVEQQYQVAGVRFSKVGKLYHFDYSAYPDLRPGDFVIVETQRGREMGQIMGFTTGENGHDYRSILRPATPRDLVLRQQWEAKQDEALDICLEKVQKIGGFQGVKFVAAQYNYDGSMLTFLYSSEQKVDVDRLWRDLKKSFSSYVDMRQIGPRDVAKLLGGYGACGELRCCSTFLTDFSPISIKMAKMQGISLNPSEITGMCGRLRCCLVYEYEQYVAARKQLPKRNKRVGTPFGEGKVIDTHPLKDAVSVFIEEVGVKQVAREELIPMDEFRALAEKSKQPCDKHGDEPCDCGKPPGERQADKQTPQDERRTSSGQDKDQSNQQSRGNRGSRGKGRSRRNRKKRK